ncbi:MAG: response regulator [Treponema sp.]|jgi:two-component system chemotaxis response regulator CheY|nr:response regulator [Treponema sp.]
MIVMVVDDSQFMRNIIKNSFAELHIPCIAIEAVDGEDALGKLAETRPELILLDWNMPKLLGIDFLKRVRDDAQYKDLPIIMVTSEGSRLNIIEALKYGATDYILKPMTTKILKEKLVRIFGRV